MNMGKHAQLWLMKVLALAIFADSINSYAQVHIVTGTPTIYSDSSFAVDLLKVGSDGNVETVEQLASSKEGLWWIETADDSRILAIMTRHTQDAVVVVDMNQGKVVKRCEDWPDVPGYVSHDIWPIEEWLVGDGNGRLFVGRYGVGGERDAVLQGMSLERDLPCETSFKMLRSTDVAKIYVQGSGGVADLASVKPVTLLVDSDGRIRTRIGADIIYLDYSVPREYWNDMKVPLATVFANNSRVLVMYYRDRENSALTRTIVYDKIKKAWSTVPLAGIPNIRAFGSTLAMSESVKRTAEVPTESAGKANLRKGISRNGPSIEFAIKEEERRGNAYPGRLHIYDVTTGKRSTIVTNEADSEVVLVDKDAVYYRVNDKLYSSPLGNSGLLPGKLIATDDRIRDAHWAFMK